jgi:DNA repair exonuclease SbcCD ATPase subunit
LRLECTEYSEQLEQTMKGLESQMSEQSLEADKAIAQWEARCEELHKNLDAYGQEREMYDSRGEEINDLRIANSRLENEIAVALQTVKTYELEVERSKQEWADDRATMEMKFRHLHEQSDYLVDQLAAELDLLRKNHDESQLEVLELKVIIGQLEDELKQANNALRSHLTDEVSMRATAMATEALKTQLTDLRKQVVTDRNALRLETECRMLAELEVEKLKADLALLAQDYDDVSDFDVKLSKMTSRAVENIVRRDQSEISNIRSNFSKIMEELSLCRENERIAENKAVHFQLQVNLLEQELTAARQEASTCKQLSTDALENETKVRQLLETRINRLTMDHESASASYRQEIDNLRLSLSHVQSERDRLSILLQESEQANTTLVHAAIVDPSQRSIDNPELEALRIERSHYISKINQDASETERRIREAVAINTAALQAQIYVEQGLRSTVERQIDDLNKQILSLTRERDVISTVADRFEDSNQNEVRRLKIQLADVMKEMQSLQDEKAELKQKLSSIELDTSRKINELIIKCNKSEEALSDVQRKEVFESSIAREVSLLKHCGSTSVLLDLQEKNVGSTEENMNPNAMDICELLNHIAELKQTINSERSYYHEVKVEHEELLALLARLNVENESLQSTITNLVGDDALHKAMIDAEHEVMRKFGVK